MISNYLFRVCEIEDGASDEAWKRWLQTDNPHLPMKAFPKSMQYACALYRAHHAQAERIWAMMEMNATFMSHFRGGDPPVRSGERSAQPEPEPSGVTFSGVPFSGAPHRLD